MPATRSSFRAFWHVLRYVRPYLGWMLLAPLAMLLETRMDLAQPAFMQRIVDEGIANGDPSLIGRIGLRMFLFALAGAVGGIGCTWASSHAATGFSNELRKAIFRRTMGLSFTQTDRFTAGSLVQRITGDVDHLGGAVSMLMRGTLRAPMLLVGSIILVWKTSPRLALPLAISAPILMGLVFGFMRIIVPTFKKRQHRMDLMNSSMQESLEGIRVVKAFAAEDAEERRFEKRNSVEARTDWFLGAMHSVLGPTLGFVQNMTTVAVLAVAAALADEGLVKVGAVMAVINWAGQVMGSFVMLSFHIMHFGNALVSAQRVDEVLATASDLPDGPVAAAPADGGIVFEHVSFRYPRASGDPVLSDVSFEVRAGEHVALVGGTGSGKSTALALVARFYDADAGSVRVGGLAVRDYALGALRGAMGIVLQNVRLFTGSIADNVRWGRPDATDEEVRAACDAAQATKFVEGFPGGWNTDVAQAGLSLSGGQRQRLAIARALVAKPKLLILDDATSAVDPATERALLSALRRESAGTTVLTVSQRIGSVRDADRIVVFERGRVAGIGTHDELMQSCGAYREIMSSQIVETDNAYLADGES